MTHYKVLFVDDDGRYAKPLIERAYTDYSFDLDYCDNWEEAISKLDDEFDAYKAVIVDGKGKKTKDSKSDDIAHVVQALTDLSVRKGKGKYIPYVVLSKYIDIKELIDPTIFFEKGKDEDVMFEFLKRRILESNVEKLRLKYPEAFSVFAKKIINKKYEHNLVEMLNCLEIEDYKKKNLNVIRDVLESVFLTLMDDYDCIPETFKNQKDIPNLEWCTRFLEGKPTNDAGKKEYKLEMEIPYYISSSIRYIKEISSVYSHLSENAIVKTSFISASYSMLEVLEWLPSFIETNFDY